MGLLGESCALSQCCSEPGMKCYKKHEQFSMCNKTCEPNNNWTGDGWAKTSEIVWDCEDISIARPANTANAADANVSTASASSSNASAASENSSNASTASENSSNVSTASENSSYASTASASSHHASAASATWSNNIFVHSN